MRIAVISELPQFLLGGIETQSYRQIRIWVRLGHEVTVFGKTLPDFGHLEIDDSAITLRRIHTWNDSGRLLRAASYFFSLTRLILQHESQIDVVYCMGLGEAAATVALLKAAGLSALPLVAMPGSAGPRGDVGYIRSVPGYRLIVNLLNRHCDAIVCIAPRLPADLAALGLQPPIVNIPVGIPIEPSVHTPDREGPLKFIAVGRTVAQKGFDILLAALARLGTRTDFTVEVIGAGPDFDRLMGLAVRLGVSDRVTWLGALLPDQVPARLLLADIFIQPSRYEGLSNAAIEAMSCKLPIIVTDCGGIDQYIDSSQGWVVPIENPEALASTMALALSTPPEVRRKMGESCRRIVEREFDIEHTALAYIDLFSSLIKKSRADKSA
jgi:glycosyltransferase involved in cell wall biosynthesis